MVENLWRGFREKLEKSRLLENFREAREIVRKSQ